MEGIDTVEIGHPAYDFSVQQEIEMWPRRIPAIPMAAREGKKE